MQSWAVALTSFGFSEVQPMTLFYIAMAASFAAEVMRFIDWIERN